MPAIFGSMYSLRSEYANYGGGKMTICKVSAFNMLFTNRKLEKEALCVLNAHYLSLVAELNCQWSPKWNSDGDAVIVLHLGHNECACQ